MFENKRIIVTMTSWKKRIQNVAPVVFSILRNTISPDLIICNLSSDEFTNGIADLPDDLLQLTAMPNFEIHWVKQNTKVFKKFIPTIKRFYPESYYMFTIDDDEIYDKTYIETGLNALRTNKAVVIAKRDATATGVWGGVFCCISDIFSKDYWENLTTTIIENGMNDPYTNKYLELKGIRLFNVLERHTKSFNPIFPNRGGKVYPKERIEHTKLLVEELFKNFVRST